MSQPQLKAHDDETDDILVSIRRIVEEGEAALAENRTMAYPEKSARWVGLSASTPGAASGIGHRAPSVAPQPAAEPAPTPTPTPTPPHAPEPAPEDARASGVAAAKEPATSPKAPTPTAPEPVRAKIEVAPPAKPAPVAPPTQAVRPVPIAEPMPAPAVKPEWPSHLAQPETPPASFSETASRPVVKVPAPKPAPKTAKPTPRPVAQPVRVAAPVTKPKPAPSAMSTNLRGPMKRADDATMVKPLPKIAAPTSAIQSTSAAVETSKAKTLREQVAEVLARRNGENAPAKPAPEARTRAPAPTQKTKPEVLATHEKAPDYTDKFTRADEVAFKQVADVLKSTAAFMKESSSTGNDAIDELEHATNAQLIAAVTAQRAEPASTNDVVGEKASHAPSATTPVSRATQSAVDASLNALNGALQKQGAADLGDTARHILEPMIADWLDENLPSMVERIVREEIERIARGDQRAA